MISSAGARRRRWAHAIFFGLGAGLLAACGGGGGGGVAVPKVDLVPVASGMQASLNGFSFPNFPSSAYADSFDANDLVTMFGSDSSVCTNAGANPCTLTAEAAAFARMVNQARATGHCEGLVALALSRFDSKESPQTVELPAKGDVLHAIMRAFATQFIPEVQDEVKGWMNKSLKDKVSAITASLQQGKLEYTLGVYTAEGGHALLPYAIEYPSKDVARIMVYDSNWPAKNRWVDVDLAAGKWSFSFSGSDPANDPNMWSGGPKDMDLTSIDKRTGTCPFCGNGTTVSKNSLLVAKNTLVVRSENLDWSVEVNGKSVSPQEPDAAAEDGVVVAPIKGAADRSAFDYLIQVPVGAPTGQTTTTVAGGQSAKLRFSGSTSLFAMTPSGIAQVTTPGNSGIPVEIGSNSIVSKDPNVNLTLASGNLVASASGPSATLEIKGESMAVTVQAANGQIVSQEVTPSAPAAVVTADPKSGGVSVLAQSSTGEVVKRDVAPDGTETKSVSTAPLNLNSTTFEAPKGLESKAIEVLPPLSQRNLANPDYKPDAAYVPPTTVPKDGKVDTQDVAATKTVLGKWSLADRSVGDAPFTIIPPTSNSDGQFLYSSSDPSVATVTAGGKVTIVGPGSTAFTLTQSATQTYSQATVTAVMKVSKGTPKVGTVTASVTKKFGDDPFQLSPPDSQSDAEFAFESSDPKVARVAPGGRVTVVGVGTTTITMSQPATDMWEATSRRLTVVVNKRTPFLGVLSVPSKTFGDADFTVAAPSSNSSGAWTFTSNDSGVISIDQTSGVASVKGAGTATIRAAQASTPTDDAAVMSVTVVVSKATPTYGSFVLNELDTTVVAPQSITVPKSSSPQPFVYASSNTSVATVDASTGRITVVGAGTSVISASQSESANFKSGAVSATLTVSKGLPTLGNLTVADRTYGSADFTVAAPRSDSDGAFTFSSSDVTVATVNQTTGVVRIVAPGTTTIRATQAATARYASASVTTSFTVAKGVPTLGTLADFAKQVGDSAFTVSAPSSNSDGAFTFTSSDSSVASVTTDTGVVTVVSSGTAVITATQASTRYWTTAARTLTVTVARGTQAPLSITTLTGTVGMDSPLTLGTTGGSGTGAVSFTLTAPGSASCTLSGGSLTAASAGTCAVTATKAGDANYVSVSTAATSISFELAAAACSPTTTIDQGYTVAKIVTTGPCTWTTPAGVTTADVLVVAGGGGGGGDAGGGGGGGGVVYQGAVAVSGVVNVKVGEGGVGGIGQTSTVSTNGGDSAFGSISAIGGGAGGKYVSGNGAAGGSGGGGGYSAGLGGAGTTDQGYAGGNSNGAAGAGGGGAGGTGANGNAADAPGGIGKVSSITGAAAYYGGGGGGGRWSYGATINNGGMGGGGRGAGSCNSYPATNGTANTGGGGGGAPAGCQQYGGAGGSGIVIVRYLTPCTGTATNLGTEVVMKFTTTGTCGWQVPAGVSSVRVLAVGGGGGGGADNGGGGGAGGVVHQPTWTVTSGSVVKVSVGAGGAGATLTTQAGGSGENSVFGSITAHGGGGGGSIDFPAGISGASSGGRAANRSGSAGAAMPAGYPSEGNDGGATDSGYGGGGGGGAGSAGVAGGQSIGGAGGAGVVNDISGVSAYFAGGGGGGGNNGAGGAGGSGIGGDGSAKGDIAPSAGAANTGSGGGGAGGAVAGGVGGAGGSGIVIVRYTPPCAPSVTTSGSHTVVSFTATGTCDWTVPAGATSVEYLVVAGGGGGASGGGGGGGVLTNLGGTKIGLTVGSKVTVTVGAGGAAGHGTLNGSNGLDSVFNGITALGGGAGGGGGGNQQNRPSSGGSGGGGGFDQPSITRASGTSGQGYAGGISGFPGYGGGAGGGGAGGAGSDASVQFNGGNGGKGGAGGAGVANSISGTVTYYGGGGGGGINANDNLDYPQYVALGGVGGGGNGSTSAYYGTAPMNNGTAGAPNTGGGGGGTDPESTQGNAGGSGIIIIRYTTP